MYFIELLVKRFRKKKSEQAYNPLEGLREDKYESCEHIFMPVDSTGEILACSQCGQIVNKKDLKKQNIFKNKIWRK